MASHSPTESAKNNREVSLADRLPVILFATGIFVGSYLLFVVQPLVARYILPWFGGTPATWTVCMLFFQCALLAGYAYAHFLTDLVRTQKQFHIHLALVIISLFVLPIIPDSGWKPENPDDPELRILLLLAATVGLPYFVLAANSPLMQRWLVLSSKPGTDPYRLFALSNLGSLLALLGFPFLIEPNLSNQQQAKGWSMGYGFFVLVLLSVVVFCLKRSSTGAEQVKAEEDGCLKRPTGLDRAFWILCDCCGSAFFLAITNTICQDVAVVPFLWVLPLSIYLITFIICFDRHLWYRRTWALPLALLLSALLVAIWREWIVLGVRWQIASYSLMLFASCMIAHGEMVRRRPAPRFLTEFYLSVSVGGAIGGIFVALIAPLIFPAFWETYIALLGVAALLAKGLITERKRSGQPVWGTGVAAVALWMVLFSGAVIYHVGKERNGLISQSRNFYGVLSVLKYDGRTDENDQHIFYYGSTIHGMQFTHGERRRWPTLYFGVSTGIGRLFEILNNDRNAPRRIGIVGLGIGVISAYAQPGDIVKYYEINPAVKEFADDHFFFLDECEGDLELVFGDARLSMEQEQKQEYDVLVLDAFSSDAIPVHLLTKEAFALYQSHLADDGVLALHITNRSLDLMPIVMRQAEELGWEFIPFENEDDLANISVSARWAIATPNLALADKIRSIAPQQNVSPAALWTDERNDLFSVLK